MPRTVTYHAATFYVTYCHVSRRYIICHVLSRITPLHSMSRIVTYHVATFYVTYCHVSHRYILYHVLSRITPLHSMSRIVTNHAATLYVTYCLVSHRYILCHVLWRITPLHSMSRIVTYHAATFYVMYHAAFCSLLFFFTCFFNCFHLRSYFYYYSTCSLSLVIFSADEFLVFFYYMMAHFYLPLSVSQFTLLYYVFFLSQCCYNLFFAIVLFDFPYTVVAIITLSTTSHSCLLLCTCTVLCFRCFIRWWIPCYIHMPYYYIGQHVIYVFYFLSVVK